MKLEDKAYVLTVPIWLNSIVIFIFLLMIVVMGVFLYMAIYSVNVLGILNNALLQLAFINMLKRWHEFSYLDLSEHQKLYSSVPVMVRKEPKITNVKTNIKAKAKLPSAEPTEKGINARHYPKGQQYVYLIQDISVTGYCKIGKTNWPQKRLYNFGVHLPMDLVVIHIIPCEDMNLLETQLHRQFKVKRGNGEWFALSLEDIEYIKTL